MISAQTRSAFVMLNARPVRVQFSNPAAGVWQFYDSCRRLKGSGPELSRLHFAPDRRDHG